VVAKKKGKPRGRAKPTGEVVKGAIALIDTVCQRIAENEGDDIGLLKVMQDALNEGKVQAVLGARRQGLTNVEIAEALEVTPQAISKAYPGGGAYKGVYGHREQRGPSDDRAAGAP
jgi:hypothetical protein